MGHDTVGEIVEELRQNYGFASTGSRSPDIPKKNWVVKALNALVDFGMAKRLNEERYEVEYRRSSQDTLKKFGYKLFKLEAKRNQLDAPSTLNLPLE